MQCNEIGKRITELREQKGMTQAELARAISVQRETVNQWERGNRDLKTKYTILLANYFNVTCDYILRGIRAENVNIKTELGLDDEAILRLKYYNLKNININYEKGKNLNITTSYDNDKSNQEINTHSTIIKAINTAIKSNVADDFWLTFAYYMADNIEIDKMPDCTADGMPIKLDQNLIVKALMPQLQCIIDEMKSKKNDKFIDPFKGLMDLTQV